MTGSELPNNLQTILASSQDRVTKAKQMAETIRKDGSYRWVGIYDVDIPAGLVSNIAWSGPGAPAFPVFPITKGLTSRAIASRKTVNVGDVASDSGYLTALDSTRSEIIVPVLDSMDAQVIGTIDVESEHVNAFDSAAQALLEECAKVLTDFWTATA